MQILFEICLYGGVARKNPYRNKINRGKRIDDAKMIMKKPYDVWKDLLWSDQSKFHLMGRLWCGDRRWMSIIQSALSQ